MDNEKLLNKLSDIENVLKIGFRMVFYCLKAIYCHQKGDAVTANSYTVNSADEYDLLTENE